MFKGVPYYFIVFLINMIIINYGVNAQVRTYEAVDKNYLESLLDGEECDRQLSAIRRNPLLYVRFIDAGLRVPKGISQANFADFGNYPQCLSIDTVLEDDLHIQGKYCSLRVPTGQSFDTPLLEEFQDVSPFNPKHLHVDEETLAKVSKYNRALRSGLAINTRVFDESLYNGTKSAAIPIPGLEFRLSVCVPRPCTSEQFLSSTVFTGLLLGNYIEDYCRFPGDKTWSPADTTAVVVFSILGVLTLLSTCYDITYRFILKKGPGTLQCLDGIRAIAMFWVVIGHSYTTEVLDLTLNLLEFINWLMTPEAVWLTVANMAVDIFFAISGLLVVYTTAEKMNSSTFLKNIHWFYINRIVRITPLLAACVLLQASLFNRVADGPFWAVVEDHTDRCRDHWWSTLFYVQNFVHPQTACLPHSWYLAIDMNLYIVSPLVLYWVLSNSKRQAWISLTASLLVILAASTAYIFHIDVRSGGLASVFSAFVESDYNYFEHYYVNILARASPFFVGMLFGYILHIYRKKEVNLTPVKVVLLWLCVVCIFGSIIYFEDAVKQPGYDQPIADSFMNSFMRPAWGAALCLVIFACVHGYGGPVNWFLCWDLWKMPSRLSYAIYLFHYPMMFTINSTDIVPVYFSPGPYFFKFLAHLGLSIIVAFVVTLLIDSPFSFLLKKFMSSGRKTTKKEPEAENTKQVAE